MVFGIVAAAIGCSPDGPSAPLHPKLQPNLKSALLDAPTVLAEAQSHQLGRGEQDVLIGLEARLPGFGGLYISMDKFGCT
jgi:hypothetical protein